MIRYPPIKLLMTTDTVGGVWTYCTALGSALVTRNVDVHLVTMGPRPRPDQRAMLTDRRVKLIESDLALEWQDAGGSDLSNAREFFHGLEGKIQPDTVHLNSFREATFDWASPVVVVAHSCVNSWGMACNDTECLAEPNWQHYTKAVANGLDKAQAWVSPSRAFHDVMRDLYHPRVPGTVIWNGISPPATSPASKRRFILAAGRMWDSAKNISALAAASKGIDWPIFVAGSGAGSLGSFAGEITSIGDLPHDSLRLRMQRASIFVSPARYEPFGLSVLEAASAGCALVLSDIPTFRELWNGAALFVDPADNRELHRVLSELCADDQRCARLQRAARERSQRYSLARTADAYLELYQNLVPPALRAVPIHAGEVHA